jgi:hypothetical protein
MPAKITLITPPDIFQNDQESILFVDLNEGDQEAVIKWLTDVDYSLNIYFYSGDPNVPWLLHALSCSDYCYINLNNMSAITSYLIAYILSKQDVFYSVNDINVAEIYSHINLNRVSNSIEFLKKVYSDNK